MNEKVTGHNLLSLCLLSLGSVTKKTKREVPQKQAEEEKSARLVEVERAFISLSPFPFVVFLLFRDRAQLWQSQEKQHDIYQEVCVCFWALVPF